MLLCTDLWKDATVLHAAYCDSRGVTEAFIKNGLKCALGAVSAGSQAQGWTYDVVVNAELQQVGEKFIGFCADTDASQAQDWTCDALNAELLNMQADTACRDPGCSAAGTTKHTAVA